MEFGHKKCFPIPRRGTAIRLIFFLAALLLIFILPACSTNEAPSVQTPQTATGPVEGQDKPSPDSQPPVGEKTSPGSNVPPNSQAGPAVEKSSGGAKTLITPEKGSSLPAPPPEMDFLSGGKIPSFKLSDFEGSVHSQEIFAGARLTVLDFWGTY